MGIIYCWTNQKTGKKYIGQTIHPDQRKRNHIHEAFVKGSDYYFHRSLRKHGVESFLYEVLEENVENLDDRENYYIQTYNTLWPNGYNQALAKTLSISAINKMSETKKKQWLALPEEEKQKKIDFLKTLKLGKKQTDTQKKKAADANSKRFLIELPDGTQQEVFNLSKFMREHNVSNIWKPGMKSKGYTNLKELPK